jgi:tetratricopeptide (TPR) repeat protein
VEGTDKLAARHELLSDAALNRLTPPARAFLHRRVATVLEEDVDEDRSASILWDCAEHWHLAGEIHRAFVLAESCATHLVDIGFPDAAADAFERTLMYCTSSEEQLDVLINQAHALYRSADWGRLRNVVRKYQQLQTRLASAACFHDELELMGIRAEWRYGDWKRPISDSLRCLNDASASPDHRVHAGVLGLMMLDESWQHEQMHSAFRVLEQLGNQPFVDPTALLEARMVYHTVCGSIPLAVEAAKEVVKIDRERDDYGTLSRRLVNAATVFRAAGFADEAYASLAEAEELAVSHRVPSASSTVHVKRASHALEDGDIATAQQCYEKLVKINSRYRTPTLEREVAQVGTRLALLSGDATEASRLFGKTIQQIKKDERPQRRVYEVALLVAIQLVTGQLSSTAVKELENLHILSRKTLTQGFAAVVLYNALHAVGRTERGNFLLSEYTDRYRRERFPLSPALFEEASIGTRRAEAIDNRLGGSRRKSCPPRAASQ